MKKQTKKFAREIQLWRRKGYISLYVTLPKSKWIWMHGTRSTLRTGQARVLYMTGVTHTEDSPRHEVRDVDARGSSQLTSSDIRCCGESRTHHVYSNYLIGTTLNCSLNIYNFQVNKVISNQQVLNTNHCLLIVA
jgi:hypothetical protein